MYQARILDDHHNEPLVGVNVIVEGTSLGSASDSDGIVRIAGIPSGDQILVFSFIGFEEVRLSISFPRDDADTMDVIRMEEAHGEMEEIAVTATRSSRTIADEPTRVEVIAGEEIDEKIAMEPSNISMLLNESPGIFVQQTSAVSGGASIRIQGLDGRYTQILKDGFPLFGGFSGGLSILQVPPLDLQQVEVIKGPSSTLYGGDAIAGLVNLVSKKPSREPVLDLLTNVTSAGGFDLGGMYRARGEKSGVTFLLTGNRQQAYDPEEDDFSNLPWTRRLTVHPTLYLYPGEQTTLSLGLAGIFEEREGGDMEAIENGADLGYLERNTSQRLTSQFRVDHTMDALAGLPAVVTLKNSVSHFNRDITVPGYRFDGSQTATYSEMSLLLQGDAHDLVAGIDVRSDAFRENALAGDFPRDYTYASYGVFVQDTWDVSQQFVLESGLRVDRHSEFGTFALPKVSALMRWTEGVSSRVSGGMGYKAPSVFLEPSEERAFQGVLPLGADVEAERSRGGSVDVNLSTQLFGRLGVSFNQALHLTRIDDPIVPAVDTEDGVLRYTSFKGSFESRAWETNAKFTLNDFKLFLGYVNLDVSADDGGGAQDLVLTPRHKTYTVLVYEKHGRGRIGLEGYWTGPQDLSDGSRSEGFWIAGVMGQLNVRDAAIFLNFENVLNTLQTDYAPVVLGGRTNPRFAEIWAPMDGFIVNGGVKYAF